MTVAERLKELRNILGLSQEELASILRVNRSFVALVESRIRKPSEQTLIALEKEVGVSKEWLKGEKELIFKDYHKGLSYIKNKMDCKKALSKYEIEFVLNLIQLSWSVNNFLSKNSGGISDMNIGMRLREVRRLLNMSQAEFASLLGLSQSFLSNLETSCRKPDEQTLRLLEKETGISKLWLETGRGLIFSDYRKGLLKTREKINLNKTLSKYEIEFILNLISRSVEGSSPVNPAFVRNLIAIFEYIYKNCKIKNVNSFGGDKKFVELINNLNIPETIKEFGMYIVGQLVNLFRDGNFEMSDKDCEIITSLLLPWGYYVGLSCLNRERKISSIWFPDLNFLTEEIQLEDSDIPAMIREENYDFHIIAGQDESYSDRGCIIDFKQKQIHIHMTLFDLVEFFLLIKTIPDPKEFIEYQVGNFIVTLSFGTTFPYSLRKQCHGFIVSIYFTEEEFGILKKIVQHIERYKKFIRFAFKRYVEEYGFV